MNPTETDRLAQCPDCSQSMSWSAEACTSCGAPNKLKHPLVKHAEEAEFDTNFQFKFWGEKCSFRGETWVRSKGLLALFVLGYTAFVFGFYVYAIYPAINVARQYGGVEFLPDSALVPSPMWFMIVFLVGYFGLKLTKKKKAFSVDFSASPPQWVSDDDSFWRVVKEKIDSLVAAPLASSNADVQQGVAFSPQATAFEKSVLS